MVRNVLVKGNGIILMVTEEKDLLEEEGVTRGHRRLLIDLVGTIGTKMNGFIEWCYMLLSYSYCKMKET